LSGVHNRRRHALLKMRFCFFFCFFFETLVGNLMGGVFYLSWCRTSVINLTAYRTPMHIRR